MKYDALLAVIVAGCANFSVFLLRPSITSELPDLALAALWFVAVFLLVYGCSASFAESVVHEPQPMRFHNTEASRRYAALRSP